MKLDKFTVTALSVVALQNLAHANTTVKSTRIRQSTRANIKQDYNNHLVSPLAELLYTKLDSMIVVRQKNTPATTECVDDYCGDEFLNHLSTVTDDMEHYVTCILQFICDCDIDAKTLISNAIQSKCVSAEDYQTEESIEMYLENSRDDVFTKFCSIYPKLEGEYLSGTKLTILQARTPNTVNTIMQYAIREGKVHINIDHQVVASTCAVIEDHIQSHHDFQRSLQSKDSEGNTGIARHVGAIINTGITSYKRLGSVRYLRVDHIQGDGAEKKSGSSAKLFGDMTLPNIMECDMPMLELSTCLMTVDKAVCDERPDGVRSLLTVMIQESIDKVSPITNADYGNKGDFLHTLTDNNDSKYIEIFLGFNRILKGYMERSKKEIDLIECYRLFYDYYTTIDKPEDTHTLGNIRLRGCSFEDESMILFFCCYFLAYTTLDELSNRLARHGYTLLHARLFPVSNIKGDTLLSHLTNIYKCELEFPLTDYELETVKINDIANVRLSKTYFGNFYDVCVRPLEQAVTLNVTRLLQNKDTTYSHVYKELDANGNVAIQHYQDAVTQSEITASGLRIEKVALLKDDLTSLLNKIRELIILDFEGDDVSDDVSLFCNCFTDTPIFLSEVLQTCIRLNGVPIETEDLSFLGVVECGAEFMHHVIVEKILKNFPPNKNEKWIDPESILFFSSDFEKFQTSFDINHFLKYVDKKITPLYEEVASVVELRIPKNAETVFGKLDYIASFYYLHSSMGLVKLDDSSGMLCKYIAYINYHLSGNKFEPRLIDGLDAYQTEAVLSAMINVSNSLAPNVKKIDDISRTVKAHLTSLYVPPISQCITVLQNLCETAKSIYKEDMLRELTIELGREPAEFEIDERIKQQEIFDNELIMRHQTVSARVNYTSTFDELGIAYLNDVPMFRIVSLYGSYTQLQIEFLSVRKEGIKCTIQTEERELLVNVLEEYSY